MSDALELALAGGGGGGLGALIMGLLKFSGTRNVQTLDKTLGELAASVTELRKEVQLLREGNVALIKDVSAQEKDAELLRERVDELAKHWANKFDEHQKSIHNRLADAHAAMLKAVADMADERDEQRRDLRGRRR